MDSSRLLVSLPAKVRAAQRKGGPATALIFFLLFLGISVLLVGCVTRGKIESVMLSLTVLKKTVINNLPQGLREESPNGRELTSGYFNPKNWEDDATERTERAYAKVTILGATRPYNIDVHVFREHKYKGYSTYSNNGEDAKLTKDLVDRIREALADRRDDHNAIDDFRAF